MYKIPNLISDIERKEENISEMTPMQLSSSAKLKAEMKSFQQSIL